MKVLLIVAALLACAVALLCVFFVVVYNRLVALRERYKNGYSQIDVQLKRRYDLIPNLVEAVKGYMTHERETLEQVIAHRNEAAAANRQAAADPGAAGAIAHVAAAETMLTGALSKLMIRQEAYPELKANQQVSQLMEELTSSENRVAFARQHYNDSVMTFNTYRQSFPQVLIAGPAGFQKAELFEIHDAREREAVQVKLDSNTPSRQVAGSEVARAD